MEDVLFALEDQRQAILHQIVELGDFRPGSITAVVRRCGKPHCRCAQPHDPGHGPNLRLTYKVDGKTRSEGIPNQAALRKVQAEIERFQRFRELVRELIRVSTKICVQHSLDLAAQWKRNL
jgi:hypothetical protein